MDNDGVHGSTIFPDRPVGLSGDLLWGESEVIREQLRRMAERIVAPLYSDLPEYATGLSDSITFAIFGKWGMGKSSALRMLQEEAHKIACEHNVADRLKFCAYAAPMHEALSYPARYTLALRMMTALAGSQRAAIDEFVRELGSKFADDVFPVGRPDDSREFTARSLQGITDELTQLPDFDTVLADHIVAPPTKVLVVLLDDLDRCEGQFVWTVLNTVQQLSSVQNLFFVLAVDQTKLREAVKERLRGAEGVSDPDFALEKYVQHAVTVPNMDERRLTSYVARLMSTYDNDPAAKAIMQNVRYIRFGLRECTPRSVKRCINTIRFDLRHELEQVASEEEQRLVVKEQVLQYTWPDFWRESVQPAKDDKQGAAYQAFIALEQACAENVSGIENDVEELCFQLKRISSRFSMNWDNLPLELLRYVGLPPYWFIRPPGKGGTIAGLLRGIPAKPEEKLPKSSKAEVVDNFMQIYFQSEAEDAANNSGKALELVEQLYQLVVDNRDSFTAKECPFVSNAAVTAEKWQNDDLATRLYQLAAELDPYHAGNLQNYVDFIVNRQLSDNYDEAQELLKRLATGELASHRPDRTEALEARLEALRGQESPDFKQKVQGIVDAFLREPTSSGYRSVMTILDEIGDNSQAEKASRTLYESSGSLNDRYLALRGLADTLSASKDQSNQNKALEIYHHLITSQTYTGTDFRSEIADVEHNFATLLYSFDYDDEAGRNWFDAYQRKRNDEVIRRAYAMYLLRASRPELAALASKGEPLGIREPVLQPKIKEMPTHFTDDSVERWWEAS